MGVQGKFAWFTIGLLGTLGTVAAVQTIDAYVGGRRRKQRREGSGAHSALLTSVRVRKAFTINRQPEVVYEFWRGLENLPRFMRHLESVEVIDNRRSRWRAKAPAGLSVEWEAEIVEERPNELLSWRSLEGATVPNRGAVRFAPALGARGTEVHIDMEYSVPGGRAAAMLAKLFGEEPEQQIEDDLRRLKQLLETGEIAISEGSLSLRQPAQPVPGLYRTEITPEGVRR